MNVKNNIYIKFLSIPTNTGNLEGIAQAVDFLKNEYADLDLDWSEIKSAEAPSFILAKTKEYQSKLPKILLSAHLDTVYAPQDVKSGEDELKIYGSGAQDVKTSIIVIFEVLRALKTQNKLKNITVALSPEEEIADPHFRDVLKDLALEHDYCLVYEATLNSGENDPLNKRSVVVQRRGIHIWEIGMTGPGGHSGVLSAKNERHSVILKLAEVISNLEAMADYSKPTTLNIGTINAGKAFNIIASEGNITFECRFFTEDEHERVLKEVESLVAKINSEGIFKVTLKDKLYFPAMAENSNAKLFIEKCKQIGESLGLEVETEKRGGGSEASMFSYCNKNAIVLDGFGIRGGGEHTNSEYVFKESIDSTIRFNTEVISSLIQ